MSKFPLDDLAYIVEACHQHYQATAELLGKEEHKQFMDMLAEDVIKRSEKSVSDDELRLYSNLIISFADC
jgi:hypothetical protein